MVYAFVVYVRAYMRAGVRACVRVCVCVKINNDELFFCFESSEVEDSSVCSVSQLDAVVIML